MKVYVRKATILDLDQIEKIIEDGKRYLQAQGSPQWQNGYGPTREKIQADIERKESYVMLVEGVIAGVAALVSGVDPVYTAISGGSWQENSAESYLSVHRVAFNQELRGQGYAKLFMQLLVTVAATIGCRDLRIDTHEMNQIMQKVILGAGFTYQGEIEFPMPNGERRAYQIILE
ncbi:GNAT family N-acetyltransferase [Enterococcus sp. HY326]|uniref:GNAT family N-acetyltransferase n=1 Tax=Enterococcus sp. HY326 TaxID=2971265 RepID=UPI0022404CE0|nr:GNAT family N-acetyltransferase [Enterococcus sp. HY326]